MARCLRPIPRAGSRIAANTRFNLDPFNSQPWASALSLKLWELVLHPEGDQPQHWRELQLQRLDLLPLRDGRAADCESWLRALSQGPQRRPAHLSLLEEHPWREAVPKPVPPHEPRGESLWLLVRAGEEGLPAIEALIERLQDRPLQGNREMTPMV